MDTTETPLFEVEERGEMLREVIDRRVAVYGNPVDTFVRVAQIWSGILDTEVTAHDVALCMMGYKILRTRVCPDYSDNSDDIAGYLDIFQQIMGDDMVHARSVPEYLKAKARRRGYDG
jgi:Domain of unknown function (DUF6378)